MPLSLGPCNLNTTVCCRYAFWSLNVGGAPGLRRPCGSRRGESRGCRDESRHCTHECVRHISSRSRRNPVVLRDSYPTRMSFLDNLESNLKALESQEGRDPAAL